MISPGDWVSTMCLENQSLCTVFKQVYTERCEKNWVWNLEMGKLESFSCSTKTQGSFWKQIGVSYWQAADNTKWSESDGQGTDSKCAGRK